MPVLVKQRSLTVALVGNPNTGKSTLFSALAGVRQRVGNYPGVTVEKKTGTADIDGRRFELIDLPGLYSLSPRSRDEMVAVDVLLGRSPGTAPVDAVVCIVDAGNLERNLYLVSQILEFGVPTVIALNMLDVARSRGVHVGAERLEARLGVPVVATQANRRLGIADLKAALVKAVAQGPARHRTPMPAAFELEVTRLTRSLPRWQGAESNDPLPRCLVQRLILDTGGCLQRTLFGRDGAAAAAELAAARARLAAAGHAVPEVETASRYAWIEGVLDGVVVQPAAPRTTLTDRIDYVLTHRLWGTLIFAVLMILVFQSVFVWAQPVMQWIDAGTQLVGASIASWMGPGALRSLLVDGVVGGVGGVLIFMPQILILFFFIAVLEDCGYMGRAAFLMDRLMSRVGLSGKSFIPMLSSFACAIPGIMAARVIEDERDRLTTILVAPLMTCSARLPVYAMLIAAFIPQHAYFYGLLNLQGLVLVALYLLGIVTAVIVALVLKRTILRGSTPPFVLELPSYKWPSPSMVAHRVLQRGWLFLRCAGTIILAVSILVWAALYYPHRPEKVEPSFLARAADLGARIDKAAGGDADLKAVAQDLAAGASPLGPRLALAAERLDEIDSPERSRIRDEVVDLDRALAGAYQRQSLLGRAGRAIEPLFRPLGWDWRIGAAVIASFPAREVVVATLGVIYNLGEDLDPESDEGATRLHGALHTATWDHSDRKVFNIPVALSLMVFFALCAQCAATLAVIRKETGSWRWPLFTFTYMTVLAYLGALATYQVGMWIGGG